MVRRGGHRVVSAATKAKISASLRGNKNAFRGGPRQKLSSRQKVANINARTKANRLNLSDAQLKQRAAVAKRLRARARAEEANGNPLNSKGIPTPSTIENRDTKVRDKVANAKKSVPKLEQKSAGIDSQTATREQKAAAKLASGKGSWVNGYLTPSQRKHIDGLTKAGKHDEAANTTHKALTESKTRIRAQAKAIKAQNGGGNFSKKENTHSSNNTAVMRRRVTEINNEKIAQHEKQLKLTTDVGIRRHLESEIAKLQSHNADIAKMGKRRADRSKPSTDPLTKATSKPKPLPHPLTRSRKPISQMNLTEKRMEANRADRMAELQPDRSAAWVMLARQLRQK